MLLTGKRVRAAQAYRHGLVDALTSPGGLVETAARAARALADGTLKPDRDRQPLSEMPLALPPLRAWAIGKAREVHHKKELAEELQDAIAPGHSGIIALVSDPGEIRIRKALEKADVPLSQIDLFEVNEAFAVVTMAFVKDMEVDPNKVNVNGGAVAMGHPIGASGARILVTLLHALRARKKKYGLAAICIGGGEATAMVVEAL